MRRKRVPPAAVASAAAAAATIASAKSAAMARAAAVYGVQLPFSCYRVAAVRREAGGARGTRQIRFGCVRLGARTKAGERGRYGCCYYVRHDIATRHAGETAVRRTSAPKFGAPGGCSLPITLLGAVKGRPLLWPPQKEIAAACSSLHPACSCCRQCTQRQITRPQSSPPPHPHSAPPAHPS